MSSIRAYAKRQLMANRNHIHLAGNLGRVRRGSVIEIAMVFRGRTMPIGWLKADKADPVVHWGRPRRGT